MQKEEMNEKVTGYGFVLFLIVSDRITFKHFANNQNTKRITRNWFFNNPTLILSGLLIPLPAGILQ
ncbi:hypothetical protein GCM10027043_32430 [Ferruginibacter profundus]